MIRIMVKMFNTTAAYEIEIPTNFDVDAYIKRS